MKITCDFCKTEYNSDIAPTMPVRCAICGHTWTADVRPVRNAWLVFVAALCALLSAIVFAVVMVTHHQVENIQNNPLVARVSGVEMVTDAVGVPHFVVTGDVQNQTDEIYGMPDLIIVMWDDDDNIVSQQKFMPSATLIDAGAGVPFTHTLSGPTTGVAKITAKLAIDTGGEE